MKYLRQFGIILVFTFIGELLKYVIPLPIPASIYGLLLLFVALVTGIIKLEQIKEISGFLIAVMPIMFVPAGVGLIDSWNALQSIVVPVILSTLVSTVLVMLVSGRVTQKTIRVLRKRKEKQQ